MPWSIFSLLLLTTFKFGEIYLVSMRLFHYCFQAPFFCEKAGLKVGSHSLRKRCPPASVRLSYCHWSGGVRAEFQDPSVSGKDQRSEACCELPATSAVSIILECDPLRALPQEIYTISFISFPQIMSEPITSLQN